MSLKFSASLFRKLFTRKGIKRIDKSFQWYLKGADEGVYEKFVQYRARMTTEGFKGSEFIIELSIILESFLVSFFNIEKAFVNYRENILKNDELFSFKKYYVNRVALRNFNKTLKLDFEILTRRVLDQIDNYASNESDQELGIAKIGNHFLKDTTKYNNEIEDLVDWCIYIIRDDKDPIRKKWSIFTLPKALDNNSLIPLQTLCDNKFTINDELRYRDGFKLTDAGMSSREVMNQINNCMFCHKHDGDYCSKGFPFEKNSEKFSKNSLGNTLTGCPLNIKISEMLFLKKSGNSIAALATLMIDNPLCPLTGYRICNDCMKSCIYQKQEPVHVPQIETRILRDVLDLPWGLEIYDLLTRWNPLSNESYMPKPCNGNKVLVVGAGPSGITMAHYLLQNGCAVVMVDGLKIEDLPVEYIESPIYDYNSIKEDLDERISWGFGGVAQYGITSRWDKNFLKLVYINLSRRRFFKIAGGVRFGGTITVEDAWRQGFDHIVIAAGAGLPKEIAIPGSLSPGMRQANDFLMALHLTGLARQNSLTSYQVRLPAVIIGGGLTAVDTATEVQVYYINQLENFLSKYEVIKTTTSSEQIFDTDDLELVSEFLSHGQEVKRERHKAQIENRQPDFIRLIKKWGGVTIAYRKGISESPAYKYNHEELHKALQEGVLYVENFEPKEVVLDRSGYVEQINGVNKISNQFVFLKAKSIFTATGANPNIAYEYEHKGTFERRGFQYKAFRMSNGELEYSLASENVKDKGNAFFTSYNNNDKFVTFIGDTHPTFHGSVVKAITSAQKAYPDVLAVINRNNKINKNKQIKIQKFLRKIEKEYCQEIVKVKKIDNKLARLTIKAPQAASSFSTGQFYKIQLHETDPICINKNPIYPKVITAFPLEVDKENGTLTFDFFLDNPNSTLLSHVKVGQRITLMGPTGNKLKIPENEVIFVFSDQFGSNVFNNICEEYKKNHNIVWHIMCLDSYCDSHSLSLFGSADRVLYFSNSPVETLRNNKDVFTGSFEGLIYKVMYEYDKYVKTSSFDNYLELSNRVDNVIVIGYPGFVQQFKNIKEYPYFKDTKCSTYILGPMQCMLKGICGQCLQWQIDPLTKKRTKAVFACSWQCQPTDIVDFCHLMERSKQNSITEKLQKAWFESLLSK